MGIVTIMLATMAGLGTLILALFWQTPVAIAIAMLTWGALLTATFAWYFRPEAMRHDPRGRHRLTGGRMHRYSH